MSDPARIEVTWPPASTIATLSAAASPSVPAYLPDPESPEVSLQTATLKVSFPVVVPPSLVVLPTSGPPGPRGIPGQPGQKGDTGTPGSGFTWKGPWQIGQTYFANDLVTGGDGNVWLATETNYDDNPLYSVNWQLFVTKGADGQPGQKGDTGTPGSIFAWKGPWQIGQTYFANDLVTGGDGNVWLATETNYDDNPLYSVNWQLFVTKGADGQPGQKGDTGTPGSVFAWKGPWQIGQTYFANDLVTGGDGNVWLATETNYDDNPLYSVNWQLFVTKGADGPPGANGSGLPWLVKTETEFAAIPVKDSETIYDVLIEGLP